MDGMIRYDFGAIEMTQADIAATSSRINEELARLKQELAPLVAEWEGVASESYQIQQSKWDNAAQDLNLILESIARAVGIGNENMNATNKRIAAQWSS